MSSQPGNGEHHWLTQLIVKIRGLTGELEALATRIGLHTDPAEKDVRAAMDCVSQLFSLIVQEVIPHRRTFSRMATVADSLRELNEAIESLQQSGHKALVAIGVYTKTLQNEQRLGERRRSNRSYGSDQQYLQSLRYEAAVSANQLVAALEGFLRVLS